jgi:UDPglucose 6-dehydrogenase
MKVAVVGCGYVGLVSGIGLASVGHRVVGIEVDERRRGQIAAGSPPFHEPGLEDLLRSGLEGEAFTVSGDLGAAVDADVVFLAVQTPPRGDGSIDLTHLADAAADLAGRFGQAAPRNRVVAVRSTVVPGTVESVVMPLLESTATVVANPEFLREGSAVADFLHPDRIVVGARDGSAHEILERLYERLGAPLYFTSVAGAELAKYTSNAFLATLVSFSNEIAGICESLPGVDVEDVLNILYADRRLAVDGRRPEILSYLKAGCGYGGSCLPKDLSALIASAAAAGLELPLLRGVRAVNEAQAGRVVDTVEQALGGLEGRSIAVLGVAFKAGTDDLRESPGLKIVDELVVRGASVTIFDPLVHPEALRPYVLRGVEVSQSLEEAVRGSQACVLTTNAPEVAAVADLLRRPDHDPIVVVDGRRVLAAADVAGADYVAVGRAREIPIAVP